MVFAVERLMDTPTTTVVHVTSTNQTQSPFSEFLFQAAVPKVSGHDILITFIHIKLPNYCILIAPVKILQLRLQK